MNMSDILFFTLLVTSAINQIHSGSIGGKSPKLPKSSIPSGGEITINEPLNDRVQDKYENRMPKDIDGNSHYINLKTFNKPLEVVFGEKGYIRPDDVKSSEPKPSDKYEKNLEIISTNPFESSLSSFGSLDTRKLRKDSKTPKSVSNAESVESLNRIIEIPDIISYGQRLGDSFEQIIVPDAVKNNPKLYEEWFIEKLPETGFYQKFNKAEPNKGDKLERIDSTKILIKKRNPLKYGFVAPESIHVIHDLKKSEIVFLPKEAKQNVEQYQKWLRQNVPEGSSYSELYSTFLTIKGYDSESLKSGKYEIKSAIKELPGKKRISFSRLIEKVKKRFEVHKAQKEEDPKTSKSIKREVFEKMAASPRMYIP